MSKRAGWRVAGVLALGGCGSTPVAEGPQAGLMDEAEAVFGAAPEAGATCGALKLAGTAPEGVLRDKVGLDAQVVAGLVAARSAQAGFDSLAALDAVPHVGPVVLERLVATAAETGFGCGTVDVQVLAFNDFHGALQPPSGSSGRIQTGPVPAAEPGAEPGKAPSVEAGGVAYLATHLAKLKATQANTVVVAAGDLVGATPLLSALFHDEPSIEAMNLAGLQIAAAGNHELDEGSAELLRLQKGGCHPTDGCQDGDGFAGAQFQYLGANIISEATGAPLLPTHTVRRFGQARIAFIGLTLENTPGVASKAGVAGLHFLDEADTVNALVKQLQADGVGAFVVLLHEGGHPTGLYNECPGISGPIVEIAERLDPAVDVLVTGHTHTAYNCVIANKIVTSGAASGRIVTDIDLRVDELSGKIVSKQANNVIVTRDVPPDPAEEALIARYDQLAAPLANRVVGVIAGDVSKVTNAAGESAMGDVIADAQLAATRGEGAVIAFMNPGGVRADLLVGQVSGGEGPGEVTYGEAFTVQPFNNLLVTMTVTGAQLESLLEGQWNPAKSTVLSISQGFTYAYDARRPMGDRVDPASMRLDGRPIEAAKTYRITVNSFLADGGDGLKVLAEGTDRVTGAVDIDALASWLAANRPLAVPTLARVRALGAAKGEKAPKAVMKKKAGH